MKKLIIRIAATLILMMGFMLVTPAIGQTNGFPPPPPDTHGSNQNEPPGGGAPVGSGLAILLALGAAYGGKKLFDARRRLAE